MSISDEDVSLIALKVYEATLDAMASDTLHPMACDDQDNLSGKETAALMKAAFCYYLSQMPDTDDVHGMGLSAAEYATAMVLKMSGFKSTYPTQFDAEAICQLVLAQDPNMD